MKIRNVLRAGALAFALPLSAATFTVTTTADGGAGSLRAAILSANATAGADTINFAIPGGGPHTIALASELPAITAPVTIDGYTEGGAAPNTDPGATNAVIQVVLDGGTTILRGLTVRAGNVTIRGLSLVRFITAIEIDGSDNLVAGSFVGILADGDTVLPNLHAHPVEPAGIVILGGAGNLIGGTTPAARNLISGSQYTGVRVFYPATETTIHGNLIGTDRTGTLRRENGRGVTITRATDNVIGGTAPGQRNVLSGNFYYGVQLERRATRNVVAGNLIGTDVTGKTSVYNDQFGVLIQGAAYENEVRDNVLSGNRSGVGIWNACTSFNTVAANTIGLDVDGLDLGNTEYGVFLWDGNDNLIGGSEADANVISGNGFAGINIISDVPLTRQRNRISHNFVGTDATGLADIPNLGGGINAWARGNFIEENVVAGNGLSGIRLRFNYATDNVVEGNFIARNQEAGVYVQADAHDNVIRRNVITQNAGTGILARPPVYGNRFVENSVFDNGDAATELGIDLIFTDQSDIDNSPGPGDGVTPNDPGDPDTGAHNLQNFPVLTAARLYDTHSEVEGSLNAIPGQYTIELFANTAADPSGHGEGRQSLGTRLVTVDGTGTAAFTFHDLAPADGDVITATAVRESNRDTSELSAAITGTRPGALQFSQPVYTVLESGVEATVTVERTGGTDGAVSISYGSGTLNFADGDASESFTVPVTDDGGDDATEELALALTAPAGGAILGDRDTASIRVLDDDGLPALFIDDVEVTEGGTALFTITLSESSGQPVDVSVASESFTFAPGETTKTLEVDTPQDTLDEADETFTVTLTSSDPDAEIADATATGTIVDDDGAPRLSISDVSVEEGDTATFTVTLSEASGQTLSVDVTTFDEQALAGSDYAATTETLTFAAGVVSLEFEVPTIDDDSGEGNETFTVALTNPENAGIADRTARAFVSDQDFLVSIGDATVVEGGAAQVDVTLSSSSNLPVTVLLTTQHGTAGASDYTVQSQLIELAPCQNTFRHPIPTTADSLDESGETFTVRISDPQNARLADLQGVVTILDDDVTISAAPASAIEGSPLTFDVTLSAASTQVVTVDVSTSDGSATAAADYTDLPLTTLTFAPGETSKQVVVGTAADGDDEPNETFTLTLTNASANGQLLTPSVTGTLIDDDGAPQLSIADASVVEGDSGLTGIAFVVTLSPAASETVTVDVTIAAGTATAGTDFELPAPQTLTFAPGETSKTVTVLVHGDLFDEAGETLFAELSTGDTATGTIVDDDAAPFVLIDDATAEEGDGAVFNLHLSAASDEPVTVTVSTSNGTAAAGSDYTAVSTAVTFDPGETLATLVVPTLGDALDETSETFTVSVAGGDSATGTVIDTDGEPALSISDVSVGEGGVATFTVTLSPSSAGPVSVDYATANGTAASPGDYDPDSGTLTFDPGETTRTLTVDTNQDALDEHDEVFFVNLTSASGAEIGDGQGTGTILDDDPLPVLTVGDGQAIEGGNVVFPILLSAPSGRIVIFTIGTVDGTAAAPGDYNASAPATFTLPIGFTAGSLQITTLGDALDEPNETFIYRISAATNAIVGKADGIGTIIDNNGAPALSISDRTVTEGNNAVFTVTLAPGANGSVTVDVSAAGDSATEGADFTYAPETLTFETGETTKTVTVTVAGDLLDEPDETYFVNLSNANGATIADGQSLGTILDDDEPPSLSVDGASVVEGDAGTTPAEFTVRLSAASANTVSVTLSTVDGTADSSDYAQAQPPVTVTFVPGDVEETVTIDVLGDTIDEDDETFTVLLTDPAGATIGGSDAEGLILDDDDAPQISVSSPVADEGDVLTFTVSLSEESSKTVTVDVATADVDAVGGTDYVTHVETLTFDPGVTSLSVLVATIEDAIDEAGETLELRVTDATNAVAPATDAVGTIVDDDVVTVSVGDVGSVAEGAQATFAVTLSAAAAEAVEVTLTTAGGTAAEGDDYQATTTTVTFEPGEMVKNVPVNTLEDALNEDAETFTLTITAVTNAGTGDATGQASIADDDALPVASIDDTAAAEGAVATFAVRLSAASGREVSVTVATADGSADAGSDYESTGTTVTFAPGETLKNVPVSTLQDALDEDAETFTLGITALVNATGSDSGAATIGDDDVEPAVTVDDASASEGTGVLFAVRLSAASGRTVSVTLGTTDGTATAPDDYQSTSTTVTFAPGDTLEGVTVSTVADAVDEPAETFTLAVTALTNATTGDGTATGTIDDGTDAPVASVSDAGPVNEGDEAVFTVSLSHASASEVTVLVETADGAATGGGVDYEDVSSLLTFAPGQTSIEVPVQTLEDGVDEFDEEFSLVITGAGNATTGDASGGAVITDTTPVPSASVSDAEAVEGSAVTFTVTLSGPSDTAVVVEVETGDGTATAPADYTATTADVTFAPGETVQTVSVPTAADALDEPAETFTITITGNGDSATGTIVDDDVPAATADLRITKTTLATTAEVGAVVAFTITVTNDGPDEATGVTVTDALPAGTAIDSITPSQGSCTGAVCALGTLASGATATISLSLVMPPAPGEITNNASVAATTGDDDMASNVSSVSVTVVGAPAAAAGIPTLSEWMLLLLAAALAAVAVRRS